MEQFLNQDVYISANSFKQNESVKKPLRMYVNSELYGYTSITAIGGESYLYGIANIDIKNVNAYTNSLSIYNDVNINKSISLKTITNTLIDYNTVSSIETNEIALLNLSKLNINLLKNINKNLYNKIIIINCHHDDFWKKMIHLSNYKVKSRKQFITDKYFITVSTLVLKHAFIPLGNSCAVGYQLNELKLRNNAYPFDWTRSTIPQLISILKNKFDNFCDINIEKYSDMHNSYLLSNSYKLKFAHELFDPNDLDEFKTKMQRRVDRFMKLKNESITFVHISFSKKETKLNDLLSELDKQFSNYKLLYISNVPPSSKDERIIHADISEFEFINWQYSNLDWRFELSKSL